MDENEDVLYLECEKWWTFALLTAIGGFLGVFTYSIRGGVFSNAQTGNILLLAMEVSKGKFAQAAYYLIPMGAYFAGVLISEFIPMTFRKIGHFRWETILAGFEIIVLIFLGFLPESAPHQISQIAISIICAMQYNTFRQAQGIPLSTTFCTNNLRQAGINMLLWFKMRKRAYLGRFMFYFAMIVLFITGGILSAILCNLFMGRAIWGAAILMAIIFSNLIHADLKKELELKDRVPRGR